MSKSEEIMGKTSLDVEVVAERERENIDIWK